MARSSGEMWFEIRVEDDVTKTMRKISEEFRKGDITVQEFNKCIALCSEALKNLGKSRPLEWLENDKSALTLLEKKINELTPQIKALGKAINETMAIQSKNPTAATQAAIDNMTQSYRSMEQQLNALYVTYEKLTSAKSANFSIDSMFGIKSGFGDAGMAAQKHAEKQRELNEAFEKYFKIKDREAAAAARSEEALRRQNLARQEATKTLRQQSEALLKARHAMLENQRTSLLGSLRANKGIMSASEANEIRTAIVGITREIKTLDMYMGRLSSYNIGTIRAMASGIGAGGTIGADAASRIREIQMANLAAAEAAERHAMAQRGLRASTDTANNSLRSQSQVLSDLRIMATQYLGVWGGQQFLRNIIQIGGQLEMQRLSIAAILQDTAAADKLFGQIKNLAIKSPFGVVELDQMTKQLAAYGFQSHELFDMTKRLADISAATGTDVSRLALALGHVRSEAALSGYTLRQFAMANVPMAKKLSEYLSKIEGHVVSVAEVRKRVKKKEISYEDVLAVIKDLTDKGGMFYNSQEVMAESLKAKFKNLKDSMDIMYGEMAESPVGDSLKVVAETLTNLTRHWEELVGVLGTVGAVWVAQKTLLLMRSKSLAAMNSTLTTYQLNLRRMTSAELDALVVSGQITKQELLQSVATGKCSAADAELAAATYGVTRAQLDQIASTGKVTGGLKLNTLWSSKYTVAQLRTIATIKASTGASKGMAVAIATAGTAFKSAAVAARSLMASLGPLLVIGGLVEWFMRWKTQSELATEATNTAFAKVEEGIAHLKQAMESLPNPAEKLNDAQISMGIEKAVETLRNYSQVDVNEIIKHANGIKSQAEQYKYLYEQVVLAQQAMAEYKRTADAIGDGVSNTGGMLGLDDDIYTDLKDYQKYLKDFDRTVDKFYSSDRKRATKALEVAEEEDASFRKRVEGLENYNEKLKVLIDENDKFSEAYSKFKKEYGDGLVFLPDAFRHFDNAPLQKLLRLDEAKLELDKFVKGYKASLEGYGYDFEHLDPLQIKNIKQQIHDFVNSEELGQLNDKMKEFVLNYISDSLGIKITVEDEQAMKAVDEMKERLDKLVDPDGKGDGWIIDIKGATNVEEVVKKIQKEYKAAKEWIETAQPILMRVGIASTSGAELWSDDYISKMSKGDYFVKATLERVRDQTQVINQALTANKALGIPLESSKKKKSGSGGGSKKDKEAEMWKERISLLEKYNTEYEKYAKMYGEQTAREKLKKDGDFASLWSYFARPEDFTGSVQQAINALSGDSRQKIRDSLNSKIATFNRKEEEKNFNAENNALQTEMKMMEKSFDLYKKIMDATGDKGIAVAMAFGGKMQSQTLLDYYEKQLSDLGAGDVMSESRANAAKKYGADNKILKLYDAITEEREKMKEEDINYYLEAIKYAKNYETQLNNIELQYEKAVKAIKDRGGDPTLLKAAEDKRNEDRSKVLFDKFKKDSDWGRIFADLDRLSDETIDVMVEKISDFVRETDLGVEETKALYEALEKLKQQQTQRNPFSGISAYFDTAKILNQGLAAANTTGGMTIARGKLAKALGVKNATQVTSQQIKDAQKSNQKDFVNTLKAMEDSFKSLQAVLQPVIDLFNALGNEDLSDLFSMGSNALGAAGNVAGNLGNLKSIFGSDSGIGKALGAAGPYGAAAAAALSVTTSLFQLHDKKLDKAINKSKLRVQELQNAYKNLQSQIDRSLGGIYSAGVYDKMLENYKRQLEELEEQRSLESDKKKSDKGKIIDYNQQIVEMRENIKYFAEDMAKALYDIDVKSWAQELTDAVVDAWAAGEDAAQAWHDKVRDLVNDITKNILTQKVVEMAMQPVLDYVTQQMTAKSGKLDESDIIKIAKMIEDAGDSSISTITSVLDALKKAGYDVGDASKSGNLSSSIGSITEEAGDLLVSYIAAIRADVSVNREQLMQICAAVRSIPELNVVAQSQLRQLEMIAANTGRSADSNDDILTIVRGFRDGLYSIKVK